MDYMKKIGTTITIIVKLLLQIFYPGNFIFNPVIFRSPKNTKKIALTFDDGPHAVNTPEILKILKERNIKATFFVLGKQLERNPHLGTMIVNDGHDLGNHSYDHVDIRKVSLKKFHSSVKKSEAVISNHTKNSRVKLIRTPFGRFDFRIFYYILKRNLVFVSWTVDTFDSFIRESEKLVSYNNGLTVKNRDILLLHEDYSHTVKALPDILDNLILNGIEFITISELMKQRHMSRRLFYDF